MAPRVRVSKGDGMIILIIGMAAGGFDGAVFTGVCFVMSDTALAGGILGPCGFALEINVSMSP